MGYQESGKVNNKYIYIINNDRQEIIETNYYELERSKSKYFLSLHNGAFRLLIPINDVKKIKKELKLTKHFKIRRGKWYSEKKGYVSTDGFNIIFDNKSENPFQIFLTKISVGKLPNHSDNLKFFNFYIYGLVDNKFKLIYERVCKFIEEDFISF
jgi:hypothetical protein